MLKRQQLTQWKGRIKRRPFALWGLLLFFIKYNLDRLIGIAFDRDQFWFLTDYFVQVDHLSLLELSLQEKQFYLYIVLASIPFIYLGTLLSLKRLRDTGLNKALLLFFFLPFLNILFFLILCLLPSQEEEVHKDQHFSKFMDRVIPKGKWASAAFATALLSLFAFPGMIFSVYALGAYGWGIFVGIPFFLGLGSSLIYSHHQRRSMRQCLGVAASSIVLFGALLILFAFEGIICVFMAAPIGLLIGAMGGFFGYHFQGKSPASSGKVFSATWILIPILILGESLAEREARLLPVKTSIQIQASRQAVWDQLVAFSRIDEPTEWLFKTGIAYPIEAEIKGSGVGAIRYCNFTTGPFVEPIEIWDEPNLLKFSVEEMPPPLVEWSPYDELHLPHLENYFVSEEGQFLLTAQSDGSTLLEGTTWYRHDIWPESYWRLWSDFILHEIHLRVLRHIKKETEAVTHEGNES